jgi:Arc/MetJ-type ribon-helix-helix transcriptional regulator
VAHIVVCILHPPEAGGSTFGVILICLIWPLSVRANSTSPDRRSIVEAVKIKGEQDAMKMVQWLFAHFHGCIVPFGAVQEAAGAGRLEILKFFKEHEVPPRADGGPAMRDEIDVKEGNVVRWGRHNMAWASFNKHDDVVHWLHENTRAPRWMKTVLLNAAYNGDIELVEWLRENYRTHDRSLVEEDEAEDDEPPPLIEADDEQPPPDNINPEDFLHVDLRAVTGGPRMAGRIVEQLGRMGVQPFIRVDPNALRLMAGEEVPPLGELLGREAAFRPAAQPERQHNSVAGNRLARAIMGRGADALTQEDPEMFNRGDIDEAVESGLLVEEIIRSGLQLDISIDLREQRDRVRQLLTNLAAVDDGEDSDVDMADPDDDMDELGEEEAQAGRPIVRLMLRGMAGGPAAARHLMELLTDMGVSPFIRMDLTEDGPLEPFRNAQAPEDLANAITGDQLLEILTGDGGAALPEDVPQEFNFAGNERPPSDGEMVEELLRFGMDPDIGVSLDELPEAIREAVRAVLPPINGARPNEAEVNEPEPVEPPRRPAGLFVFDREGDVEGENVGELLRGDPSEFMRMAAYGGHLEMMEWLFRNGYVRDCYLNVWVAIDCDRLNMLEWLIEHKLIEAGRALEAAARLVFWRRRSTFMIDTGRTFSPSGTIR